MHFSALSLGLLAAAHTAIAGTVYVRNNSPNELWLTITRSDQTSTQSTIAVGGGFYSEPAAGSYNSLGVTKTSDYWNSATPKLIYDYTLDTPDNLLYWTVSNVDGDPFTAAGDGWEIFTSDTTCSGATTYDGQTHTCEAATDLTLVVY